MEALAPCGENIACKPRRSSFGLNGSWPEIPYLASTPVNLCQ